VREVSDETARPPGRPRSEEARRAILEATAALLTEVGYGGTTVETVAARAGVGKQTIYRWWPTKADLVLEASAGDGTGEAGFAVPAEDHGSYPADLRAFLLTAYTMAAHEPTADLLRSLMVEAQLRPEFGERFRERFLAPRRTAFAAITDRAAERGDLPAYPAPATVADVVFGTLWYRLLATREPLDEGLAGELVVLLTQ
jgi:AcrR family transcriptional regulator